MADKIVVFGSFNVDLMTRSDHLPVVGETVKGNDFKMGPGGKGSNQAIAAKRAGGDVNFVTKIGKDTFGKLALDTISSENMDVDNVIVDEENSTGAALILVDSVTSENEIVVAPSACDSIKPEDLANTYRLIDEAKLLVVQLETNLDAVENVVNYAADKGKAVILNPAPYREFDHELLKKITYITPNEVEAAQITGITIDSMENAKKAAKKLYDMGVKTAVITWGKNGVIAYDGKEYLHLGAFNVKAVDTTGAGDAFNGGFAAAVAEGKNLREAMLFANATAALSVTKIGAAVSMAKREEIDAFLKEKGAEAEIKSV